MKIKSLLVAALAVFLVACGSVENTPEAITKAFVKAMADKDFDEAAGYCTESSAKVVEGLGMFASKMPSTTVDKEEVSCDVQGDKAKCKFCCVSGKEESYDLVKVNGNWKLEYMKSGMNNAKEGLDDLKEGMDQLKDGLDTLKEVVDSISVE